MGDGSHGEIVCSRRRENRNCKREPHKANELVCSLSASDGERVRVRGSVRWQAEFFENSKFSASLTHEAGRRRISQPLPVIVFGCSWPENISETLDIQFVH